MILDKRSVGRLAEIHPDLARVVIRAADMLGNLIAITGFEFFVTEGKRTADRQKQLVEAGASKTMNSRHLTGHAVDLAVKVGGEVRWDWPLYDHLGTLMKAAAKTEGVPIVWGGDWPKFKDGPHFELSRKEYP